MTELEYKAQLREQALADAKTKHEIALFHPVGGRKVVDLKKSELVELEELKAKGWTSSPRDFWPEKKVLEAIQGGFFNVEHPIDPNGFAVDDTTPEPEPDPEFVAKTALFTRGSAKQAVQGQPGDSDSGDRKEPGSETSEPGSDKADVRRGRSGSKGGAKAKAAVDKQAG